MIQIDEALEFAAEELGPLAEENTACMKEQVT